MMRYNPEVFRMAAESIADKKQRFCCTAIITWSQVLSYDFELEEASMQLFKCIYQGDSDSKGSFPDFWWKKDDADSRILALLLAAEIATDENKRWHQANRFEERYGF